MARSVKVKWQLHRYRFPPSSGLPGRPRRSRRVLRQGRRAKWRARTGRAEPGASAAARCTEPGAAAHGPARSRPTTASPQPPQPRRRRPTFLCFKKTNPARAASTERGAPARARGQAAAAPSPGKTAPLQEARPERRGSCSRLDADVTPPPPRQRDASPGRAAAALAHLRGRSAAPPHSNSAPRPRVFPGRRNFRQAERMRGSRPRGRDHSLRSKSFVQAVPDLPSPPVGTRAGASAVAAGRHGHPTPPRRRPALTGPARPRLRVGTVLQRESAGPRACPTPPPPPPCSLGRRAHGCACSIHTHIQAPVRSLSVFMVFFPF